MIILSLPIASPLRHPRETGGLMLDENCQFLEEFTYGFPLSRE
jgi:hypothetical protein